MQQIFTIAQLREIIQKEKKFGKTVGFVPTMGALHAGHISLVNKARSETDVVVCSIFVNPTQFNDPNDLQKYPRTPEQDKDMLLGAGCDILFSPSVEEMYPIKDERIFDLGGLDKIMEGAYRPGHFNGVAQIVSKLFDAVKPDRAYFGKKDFQQLAIIKYITQQLKLPIQIIACDTIRENDGLAMSSRNVRLNDDERKQAVQLSRVLFWVKENASQYTVKELKLKVSEMLANYELIKTEYFEIADAETLQPVDVIKHGKTMAFIAAYVGNVRLIDNISL